MFLQHRYGLGYETLCKEVADSFTWRSRLGGIAGEWVRSLQRPPWVDGGEGFDRDDVTRHHGAMALASWPAALTTTPTNVAAGVAGDEEAGVTRLEEHPVGVQAATLLPVPRAGPAR